MKNYTNKILENLGKEKYTQSFIDNIWSADLADIQMIRKCNKGFRFLLCVTDIYSKYAWVISLKDKILLLKGTITNAFQKVLNEPNCKPNKIWVDKGREFYNRSMKSFFQNSDTKTYSTHNEEKSMIAKRFTRTLKNRISKYMTSKSKNMYIDKLDDIANKYNNTCHSTVKMKSVDKKLSTYIDSSKENNEKDPKFKIGDFVWISKYKTIVQKVTLQISLKTFL